MTFLEALRSHKGGLVRIKSDLYWYGGRGWDGITGRVCLLLNAGADARRGRPVVTDAAAAVVASDSACAATIELIIDGTPHWVWVAQSDVELL